jgi:hypothetical protein
MCGLSFVRRAGFCAVLKAKLAFQTTGSLVYYNFMADGDPVLAALGLKESGTDCQWSFQVSDIVLTAPMLAGGADPLQNLMDVFRELMEASSAKASGTAR